jgi:hypothetical protein
MTTAFQLNAFQPDAFQIGAPRTITVDEVIPRAAATITTVIAISGWVFSGTAQAAPAFNHYDMPRPAAQAPRQVLRPYADTWIPPAATPPVIVDSPMLCVVPGVSSVIVLPGHVFIPPASAPAFVHPDSAPPSVRAPRPAIRPQLDIYIPPAAAAVIYPIALREPERAPISKTRAAIRMDQEGTAGVFFFMPQYDFEWSEKSRPAVRINSAIRFNADPYMPTGIAPTYDYGWYAAPRLPIQPKPSLAQKLTPDTYIGVAGRTYDYGWFAPPALPIQPRLSNARNIIPDLFFVVAPLTYDYGWYAPPRVPPAPKPSNARFNTPDLFWYFTGRIADYSNWAEPRRPIQPKPSNYIRFTPDTFITIKGHTADFNWTTWPPVPAHFWLPIGARAYIDRFPWFVLNLLEPMNNTSTTVLYLPYSTDVNSLPYTTRSNSLPYTTEEND